MSDKVDGLTMAQWEQVAARVRRMGISLGDTAEEVRDRDAVQRAEFARAIEGEAPAKTTYPTGATRSADADALRYDLIPPGPLRRLARRYAIGATAHGERNWERGLPTGSTINHLVRHLELWREGDRSDDHLAAVAWGAFALMFFEDREEEKMETNCEECSAVIEDDTVHQCPWCCADGLCDECIIRHERCVVRRKSRAIARMED